MFIHLTIELLDVSGFCSSKPFVDFTTNTEIKLSKEVARNMKSFFPDDSQTYLAIIDKPAEKDTHWICRLGTVQQSLVDYLSSRLLSLRAPESAHWILVCPPDRTDCDGLLSQISEFATTHHIAQTSTFRDSLILSGVVDR